MSQVKVAPSEKYTKEQRMTSEDEQILRARLLAQRAGEAPMSLSVLQKEAQKRGADVLTQEEIEKEITAARAMVLTDRRF